MKRPTILVVDDEQGFLQIMQVILQRAGYHPKLARGGEEGLRQLQLFQPDLVILDDNMPDITGGEICAKLKADPDTSHIPVIMYSAGSRIHNEHYVDHIGADAVLTKPSMPNEILEAVQSCLSANV